ncbi:MAG TPA: hypothetical protein VLK84_14930 [Longimicrobium sp.]|nr:hypothetical protein [Longimicrobium sp.]
MSNQDESTGANGEREAIEALNQIQEQLRGRGTDLERFDADDACATYRRIKPFLERVLPWIERLPRFGRQLAEAIRFLMSVADRLCPA